VHKILLGWTLISLVLVIGLAIEKKESTDADMGLAGREETIKADSADDLSTDFEDFSAQKIDQLLC